MTQNNDVRDIVGAVAHMKKRGTLKVLLFALIVGVALFLIGSLAISNKDDVENADSEAQELIDFFDYKEMLEREIEDICSSLSGVSDVRAVTFFSDVGGSVYAQNTQVGNSSNEKNEYVIIGSGSNAHALYLGESLPKLSGIGIVCNTGGDETKRNEILCLLASAYGLSMTHIYVSEAE